MDENRTNHSEMKRRGYLKGLAATGLGTSALATATRRSDAHAENHNTDTADGGDLYLVFGADSSADELDSWVEDHRDEIHTNSQQASAQVIQYQDVTQISVNQQNNAVAISVDGGEAEAIQAAEQTNSNNQSGSAESINIEQETNNHTFSDINDAYVVFAEETECREYSGWVVSDESYQPDQSAQATIEQTQEVNQFNFNSQNTAVAIAEGGSCSQASQLSYQENENLQAAEAVAVNIGESDSQSAESSVEQTQEVTQLNVNEQGIAIAIAVGENSVAEAQQLSFQSNRNEQLASATALNFDSMSVDSVVAKADMSGEFLSEKLSYSTDGSSQSNTQEAAADISQVQSVGQENINLQNAAIAVGLENSEATARQASYQGNFNAQVASATAVNSNDGTHSANAVLNGADMTGDESWAIAYENGDDEIEQQVAEIEIDQLQIVQQLNVNEQFGAIAFATDCGEAVAEQLNFQLNENVQVTEATAVNEGDENTTEKDNKESRCEKN
ncbi:hypothetical protein HAPAU_33210 [Halalkalicoccus paucihalophilus]|uniref:Uncharacterized protein n=1 Tax=Halalkalicoccus paucihalophilus TaxID=1008153 RepID=A0A151A9G0_9EURY|nr:hypothetical protein [Halalkalicoccus paucihalophilus]KYH24338.1 hypothetical protein HAPAU_33210 [Halalkalicoccus paucihalophilus]